MLQGVVDSGTMVKVKKYIEGRPEWFYYYDLKFAQDKGGVIINLKTGEAKWFIDFEDCHEPHARESVCKLARRWQQANELFPPMWWEIDHLVKEWKDEAKGW